MTRPTFLLTIRSTPPTKGDRPVANRLRWILKRLLRWEGFECLDCHEESEPTALDALRAQEEVEIHPSTCENCCTDLMASDWDCPEYVSLRVRAQDLRRAVLARVKEVTTDARP